MKNISRQEITDVVKSIIGIHVEGTCCPQAEHNQIAKEAMKHLHTVMPDYVLDHWDSWKDACDNDREIIANIAVARACEIVANKHKWDVDFCFEAISYSPIFK